MAENLLQQLVEALRCLPGVGPKSAQRIAFHLLLRDRDGADHLGELLQRAMKDIGQCRQCRNYTESTLCHICSDSTRADSEICVVESPADVLAIEQATSYNGLYFVLMGHLSPLDGIGPADLGLDLLAGRVGSGEITELTLATNPTVEGAATASYIRQLAAGHNVKILQIARGIPVGGELEFTDGSTLAVAFADRSEAG